MGIFNSTRNNLHRTRCLPLLLIGLAITLFFQLGVGDSLAQARKIKRISAVETEETTPVPEGIAPPLPEQRDCEAMTRQIAAAYGSADMQRFLAEDFPNKSELLDSLSRADMRVTNIGLRIDAVESIRIQPWHLLEQERRGERIVYTIASDCVIDLRLRAVFDTSSGDRTVTDPRSDEWRVRLITTVTDPGQG